MSDVCDSNVVHHEEVAKAQAALPADTDVLDLGDFFKAFGDPTRLRILLALLTGELCVCDLSVTLDMSVSAVSHQLGVLRRARLVANRRDGKIVYYRLDDVHVKDVLTLARTHLEENR
jgi:ArsR family transcriptional regulator